MLIIFMSQDLLQQITGYRSSFTFTDAENTIVELAGANFPWRTGLAPLNTFRVSQVHFLVDIFSFKT